MVEWQRLAQLVGEAQVPEAAVRVSDDDRHAREPLGLR
jgi:hypothetical protein